MTDNYVELLIKRKTSPMVKALHFSGILMGVFQLLLLVLSHAWFFVFSGAFFIGLAYLIAYMGNVEYEYLYLDKQFSIDRIYNRKKRKKAAEYDLQTQLEVLAPAGSGYLQDVRDKVSRVKNFTSGKADACIYEMVVHEGKELWLIKIEMTDELWEQLYMTAPRKVYKI